MSILPKSQDTETLLDLIESGHTRKEMSDILQIPISTLQKRLCELRTKQSILTSARELRNLRLTELQFAILEHLTPDKLADASLKDLVSAYKIFADRETIELGQAQAGEVKGLVQYLIQLEKTRVSGQLPEQTITIDIDVDDTSDDGMPDL